MQHITIIGHTAIDYLMRVDEFPAPNSSVPARECVRAYGGGAANICTGIAKLGGRCTLRSAVGRDFVHSDYMRHLEHLGIGLELHVSEQPTSRAYVMTDGSGDQMTIFYWGASSEFEHMVPKPSAAIHMATGHPAYNARAAQMAEFASFDPGQDIVNYDAKMLDAVLSSCQMLICNRHEMERILSMLSTTLDELLERLHAIIVTMDRDGSVVHTDGSSVHVPAVRTRVIDPTGAGDGYRSGLFTALQRGYDLVSAAKVGSTVASFVIEGWGAQSNQPTWDRMMDRLVSVYGRLPEPPDSA